MSEKHAYGDGPGHEQHNLKRLAELQGNAAIIAHEVNHRQRYDQRQRHDGQDGVDGRECEIQGQVATREMTEHVGKGTAWCCGYEHQSNCKRARQGKAARNQKRNNG